MLAALRTRPSSAEFAFGVHSEFSAHVRSGRDVLVPKKRLHVFER